VETSLTDYPKYGVWPQGGDGGSYLMGANAGSTGRDLFAFDRAKMLAGQPASFQKFTVPGLPNSGFELVLPGTLQGKTAPPDEEPAIFARPRDDEAQDGASTPAYDVLELWALKLDWRTPANSALTQLPSVQIGDYDMTLCGLGGTWNCMPQPGTTQRIDPIREPLHHPFVYRNFGDHQTLVGTFVEDVDGTDHAAQRWFELRKTSGGSWGLFQEGVVGGEPGVHRAVASVSMDGSGNIAMGYTRTGGVAPYYPSIYYKGRLSTDPPGTMPQGEYVIQDASFSKTNNERWGDYTGIGVDPADDCTFWFTTEYMSANTTSSTRVAALKFEACGCLSVPPAPTASASAPQDNRIDVSWDDSSASAIVQYLVFRSTTAGGPYTQIATVPDSSPGVGNGPSYTYHDDTVSGGTRYYYVVKSTDGVSCFSLASGEVNALATGQCLLPPAFSGVTTVTNPGNDTCTLNLGWNAGASVCSGALAYNLYRDTASGFTPAPENRIAAGLAETSYTDAIGIAGGTAYYYVVRAVDVSNGVEETNAVRKSGVPTGPITTTTWTDTFEGPESGGGFDLAGWTRNPIAGTTSWTWSTAQKQDGTHSWFAQDVLSLSDKVLAGPAFGVGPATTLSFWHTYAFEGSTTSCYDGGTLEYSTDGTTWAVVPAADFVAGGYTGTINSGYSNPLGGKRAWCAGTVGAMTQVTVNLGGDANLIGRNIRVRWHEGDDSSISSTGWYVDAVVIGNAEVGGACTIGTVCTPPGAPSLASASGDCAGVHLAWSAGTGSTASYNVYRATTTGGPYTKLSGMPVTGTAYTDTTALGGTIYVYIVRGACNVSGATESADSNELSASGLANGAACDDGNACTAGETCQAGVCPGGAAVPGPGATSGLAFDTVSDLSWAATDGATGYDVIRGTLSMLLGGGGFTPATDTCAGSHVAGTLLSDPHLPIEGEADWFLIRAYNLCGTGTYDDGDPSQSGPRDAGIAASPNACP
jgi:fibronectin type 3 domain-containing protein